MDFVYLKNVLLQFLEQKDKNHQKQLIPVLGMLLHFDRWVLHSCRHFSSAGGLTTQQERRAAVDVGYHEQMIVKLLLTRLTYLRRGLLDHLSADMVR